MKILFLSILPDYMKSEQKKKFNAFSGYDVVEFAHHDYYNNILTKITIDLLSLIRQKFI